MRFFDLKFVVLFFMLLGYSCHRGGLPLENQETIPTEENDSSGFYINPVFQPVLADPTMIRDSEDGFFYAYGTEDDWADGKGRRVVPILRSENMVNWRYIGDAFKVRPNWKPSGGIWAPDINKIQGKYYLYYAFSVWGDENPGIGVATSTSPEGPFTDHGKILDSKMMDVPNSIDPFLYSGEDARNFLFWGSYSDLPTQGTFAIELDDQGLKIKKGAEKVKIAAGDFEAVTIHKRGDYFYFLGSKGSCCDGVNSSYHVMIARAEKLMGPYFDMDGNRILDRGAGTLFLSPNKKFKGTGHTSNIITDRMGVDWIMYHAIDANIGKLSNGTNRRVLMLDRIEWREGWPYIKDNEPSTKFVPEPEF